MRLTPRSRSLLLAVLIPTSGFAAITLTASVARAGDEAGCRCKPSKCSDADEDCYTLICSDNTSKICDGHSIAS